MRRQKRERQAPTVTPADVSADKMPQPKRWYDGFVFWGALVGLIFGTIGALLYLPFSGRQVRQRVMGAGQDLRGRMENRDPVAESLAAGREAARQRREALAARDDTQN